MSFCAAVCSNSLRDPAYTLRSGANVAPPLSSYLSVSVGNTHKVRLQGNVASLHRTHYPGFLWLQKFRPLALRSAQHRRSSARRW